jgi:hypothetical protein
VVTKSRRLIFSGATNTFFFGVNVVEFEFGVDAREEVLVLLEALLILLAVVVVGEFGVLFVVVNLFFAVSGVVGGVLFVLLALWSGAFVGIFNTTGKVVGVFEVRTALTMDIGVRGVVCIFFLDVVDIVDDVVLDNDFTPAASREETLLLDALVILLKGENVE